MGHGHNHNNDNHESLQKFVILNSSHRYLDKFKMTVKEVIVKFSDWTIDDRNISDHIEALLEYLTSGKMH